MKKKGLIISTVVMVVVLIASLTTATYAWFTADSRTTIEAIPFSVNAGSDVSIGLKADNIYEETVTPSSFVSGSTAIDTGFLTDTTPNGTLPSKGTAYWTGNNTLGSNIDMQLDLSDMAKAVGSGTLTKVDSSLALNKLRKEATATQGGFLKASGYGAAVTGDSVERAIAQKDYLDVVIGVQATATNLTKIVCNVTVNPNSTDRDLGMNAAIHMAWKINGKVDESTDGNVDFYGDNHFGDQTGTLQKSLVDGKTSTKDYGGSETQVLNNGAKNIPITIASVSGADTYISRNTIYQLHLVIWIDGADSDCQQASQGVGSNILINFSTEKPAAQPGV